MSAYIEEEVDFLKLDVEGAEQDVVADLHRTAKLRLVAQIVCEYHHHIGGEDRLGDFLGVLEQSGFGYELQARERPPFRRDRFQDVLIYAYRKQSDGRR